jgi:hypothetical protein
MEIHVKVLGALQIVIGALGTCAVLLFVLVFSGAAHLIVASGQPNAGAAAGSLGLIELVLVCLIVITSLPALIVGIGLVKRRPWARIGGIVLCMFELMFVPFGTMVGVYGLWVLFSKETETLFTPVRAASS